MKKSFTKLEIILGAVIVFSIIGYLGSKNVFISKEKLLRQRFNIYISLLDQKNYSEAYKLLCTSNKNNKTLEKYLSNSKESEKIGKQKVNINSILIEGDIGYIDRNNTICEDQNCFKTLELRGYKKWVFENENWYYCPPDPKSIRKDYYDIPEEFKRGLSLIEQRIGNKYNNEIDFSFLKSLDIKYSQLEEEDGIFVFTPGDSSIDKLSIYVNNSFKIKDDLLIAFLLSHEVSHAGNYLVKINSGTELSCYDEEIQAFQSQLIFLGSLNQEEQDSLVGRIATMNYSGNSPLMMVRTFIDFSGKALRTCGSSSSDCYSKQMYNQISNMVKNNPYYQKQCSLN